MTPSPRPLWCLYQVRTRGSNRSASLSVHYPLVMSHEVRTHVPLDSCVLGHDSQFPPKDLLQYRRDFRLSIEPKSVYFPLVRSIILFCNCSRTLSLSYYTNPLVIIRPYLYDNPLPTPTLLYSHLVRTICETYSVIPLPKTPSNCHIYLVRRVT